MNISTITEALSGVMDSINVPANILPAMLLKCTSLQRPGLSAYKITSEIIQNNQALGIPTGDNPDGTPNLINAFIYNIVKTFVHAIKNDATVQISIPSESLVIQGTGGNAGGPVVITGTNLLDSIANGIMS